MELTDFYKLIIWDVLNPFFLNLKKNKRYKLDFKYTGLNLGGGIDNPPNWLDIDGGATHFLVKKLPKFITSKFFKNFHISSNFTFNEYYKKLNSFDSIYHNLSFGIPFGDETVPNIFSSHFFEHLFKEDCEFVLKESYRVLKPSGIIRICVPSLDDEVNDIENAINEYKNGNTQKVQKYVTSDIVGHYPKFSVHRYMYNFEELKYMLENAGFIDIEQKSFKKGSIPNVEKLDTRNGLIVEARKE